MTVLGVERMRTAFRRPSVPPAGVSALMPPHIQEAERRTERRDRRTRWGLRVLVLGGLAGMAWLLTGAAAPAADRTDGPVGSLLGAVVGDGDASSVSGLLSVAAQPLESDSLAGPIHLTGGPATTLRAAAAAPRAARRLRISRPSGGTTPRHRPSHLTSDASDGRSDRR